jgi:hypothetical protein
LEHIGGVNMRKWYVAMRHHILYQVVVRIAESYRREFLVEEVQTTAGIRPRRKTVPDKSQMFKLLLVPERT